MADFDMWGPAQNGARLAQQDEQKMQMNNLAMQEDRQNIQMNQGKMLEQQMQLQDHAKQQQMETEQQAQAKQQQAQTLDILQRNQTASSSQLGELMIHAGLIKQGSDLLKVSSEAANHLSQADKNTAEADEKKLDSKIKQTSMLNSVLENTHSQEDFTKAVSWYEKVSGQTLPDEVKNVKWTPELKDSLKTLGMSSKDKLEAELNAKKEARLQMESDSSNKKELQQLRVEEAKERISKIQENRTAKEQGDQIKLKAADPKNVKAASSLIKEHFPDAKDDAVLDNASRYVVSKAQDLLKKNPGVDTETALNQSFLDAMSSGEIKPNKESHLWGPDTEGKSFSTNIPAMKQDKPAAKATTAPSVGTVQQGYKFKGGDPSDKNNWEQI